MKSRVYSSYGNIKRFLDKNHLLSGTIHIKDSLTETFIPITNIRLHKLPTSKDEKPQMQIYFDSLDRNVSSVSGLAYSLFLRYMGIAANNGFGYYIHHQIKSKIAKKPMIDYVSGHFDLPTKMIRKSFRLNKQHFNIIKFISQNEHSIVLLCSPTVTGPWIEKLGMHRQKLTKRNLVNLLLLIHYHLFNPITEIKTTNDIDILTDRNPIHVIKSDRHILTLRSDLTSYRINLKHTDIIFDTPSNKPPMLVIKNKNHSPNDLKYTILFKQKSVQNFLASLNFKTGTRIR